MKIEINRAEKLELLNALQSGILDTDKIPALKTIIDNAKPARILSKQEAKELLKDIENNY